MKVVLRLAILVAALLLVSNASYAAICLGTEICYNITATDQNGNTVTDFWNICLRNDGTGYQDSDNDGLTDLYLFGGGPGWFNTSGAPAFGGNPNWSSWIALGTNRSGFLQPIGDGYMLTGEGHDGATRWTIIGTRVVCD
jgi:hypothetical protein